MWATRLAGLINNNTHYAYAINVQGYSVMSEVMELEHVGGASS
jgi:hypothetical protein